MFTYSEKLQYNGMRLFLNSKAISKQDDQIARNGNLNQSKQVTENIKENSEVQFSLRPGSKFSLVSPYYNFVLPSKDLSSICCQGHHIKPKLKLCRSTEVNVQTNISSCTPPLGMPQGCCLLIHQTSMIHRLK